MASLFDKFIQLGSIPDDLKCAIVFALIKKGDRSNCDNYRGISVLSSFAQIFERILAADITAHFVDNDHFSEAQHGFRNKRSCETALQSILERWKQSAEAKQIILALSIDFKKAFDLIYPELLLIKLFHYGFDYISLSLIRDYFKNRSQVSSKARQLRSKGWGGARSDPRRLRLLRPY